MIRLKPKTLQRMLAKAGDAVVEKFEELRDNPKYYTDKSIRGGKADEESAIGKIEQRDRTGRLKSKAEIIDELGKKKGVTKDEEFIDLGGVGTGKMGFDKPDEEITRATRIFKGKRVYESTISLANKIRKKNPGMTSAQANAIAKKRLDKFNLDSVDEMFKDKLITKEDKNKMLKELKGKDVVLKSLGGPQFKKNEFENFVNKELIPTINANTTRQNKRSNETLKKYFKDFADRKTGFFITNTAMAKKYKSPVGSFKKFSPKNSKNWEQVEGGVSLKDELANFFESSDFNILTKKSRKPLQLELDPRPEGALRKVSTQEPDPRLEKLREAQRVYSLIQNPAQFQRVGKQDESVQKLIKALQKDKTKGDLTVKRSDLLTYTLNAIANLQSPEGKLRQEIIDVLSEPIGSPGGASISRYATPITIDPKTGRLTQRATREVSEDKTKEKLARVRGEYDPRDAEVEDLYTAKGMEFETANVPDLLRRLETKSLIKSIGASGESKAEVKPFLKFNYTPTEFNRLSQEDQLTIERATQIYRQAYAAVDKKLPSRTAEEIAEDAVLDAMIREDPGSPMTTPTRVDTGPAKRGQPYLPGMEPNYSTTQFTRGYTRQDFPTEFSPSAARQGPPSVQRNISSLLEDPQSYAGNEILRLYADILRRKRNLAKGGLAGLTKKKKFVPKIVKNKKKNKKKQQKPRGVGKALRGYGATNA